MKCSLASHVASHTVGTSKFRHWQLPPFSHLFYVAVTTVITDVKQRNHKVVVVTVLAFCMILNLTFFYLFSFLEGIHLSDSWHQVHPVYVNTSQWVLVPPVDSVLSFMMFSLSHYITHGSMVGDIMAVKVWLYSLQLTIWIYDHTVSTWALLQRCSPSLYLTHTESHCFLYA